MEISIRTKMKLIFFKDQSETKKVSNEELNNRYNNSKKRSKISEYGQVKWKISVEMKGINSKDNRTIREVPTLRKVTNLIHAYPLHVGALLSSGNLSL
jgi:phosphorylcholine metabolism protein LicD